MNTNSCVRVLADENQISQCRADLASIEEEVVSLASLLSLAGNEVRFKILYLLHREGQMCPCDLSDVLEMTMPAISQHLRKMKDKDLIKSKKVGQTIFYSISHEHNSLLESLFKRMLQPSIL